MRPALRRPSERGSALLLAMALVLAITLIGAAILNITGQDRIAAGRLGLGERAQACAEAGVQYGRRMFGLAYETSAGWNELLDGTRPGYAYANGLRWQSAAVTAPEVVGRIDGDPDGDPDFWVSIRDDDDERPFSLGDVPTRDNNEVVILRAACVNPFLLGDRGQQTVIEVRLAHVQGSSGYGNAQITSNSPDIVGTR